MNEKMNNDHNNIIIFGASRGIGKQISSNLLKKKYDVTISSGNKTNLESACNDLQTDNYLKKNLNTFLLDLADYKSIKKKLKPFINLKKTFSALVFSSAVLGPSGSFYNTDLSDWEKTFHVNSFAPAYLIQFFLQNNLLCNNSKIIILSGGISGPDPFFNSFSATKHALNGFIYSLSYELANKNIWVNSILPGSYHTKMNEQRIDRGPNNIGFKNYEIALSRKNENEATKYNRLNNLVEFLCSSSSNGIFGRLISAQYDDWINNITRLKDEDDDLYKIIRTRD